MNRHRPCRTARLLMLALIGAPFIVPGPTPATVLNDPAHRYAFQLGAEQGFIVPVRHTIQFGRNGTAFDYIKEGGQNNLFPFTRMTAELQLKPRHAIIFLAQPLDIQTKALLTRDVTVNDVVFPSGTPVDLRYGFTFYRFSYLYDFNPRPDAELAIGGSFQIRNAAISFASQAGDQFTINQNIGPVGALKFRARLPLPQDTWLGTEIDGLYASGRYITGSANDFVGAILDGSLRYGFNLNESWTGYLNLRYLGGGARGTQRNYPGPGDGYTNNWLHTVSFAVGVYLK